MQTQKPVVRWHGARLVSAFGGGSFYGASSPRELASWNPGSGSADADLLPDIEILRARNRDLDRNNGIASGAIRTTVDNVIGTGLRLYSIPDYRALGKDVEWAIEWGNKVEAEFRAWSLTTDCDATRMQTFAGLTRLVAKSVLINGEALALPLWLETGSKYRTRIQVIESDRLSTPHFQVDTDRLRGGVEIDSFGAPVAYWIRTTHPGDCTLNWSAGASEWERVPARSKWGRRRVIHVFDRERAGQNRGIPAFASTMGEFFMLDRYRKAELQAAIVNAMVSLIVKTPMPPDQVAQMFTGQDMGEVYDARTRQYRAGMQGGAILPLMPGDDVHSHIPARPASAFGTFTEHMARHIGVAVGLPYELIMKDFSKTNYSSARAGLLEAWRYFLAFRRFFTEQWTQPVYELWLEEAINAGVVDAPDFYSNRFAYSRAKWLGPGRGWVDPVKEVEAARLRMDSMVSTLEDECAEQGSDWEEVLDQQARERARIKELGLDKVRMAGSFNLSADEPEEQTKEAEDQPAAA
jgi:lambda family phage portal protein